MGQRGLLTFLIGAVAEWRQHRADCRAVAKMLRGEAPGDSSPVVKLLHLMLNAARSGVCDTIRISTTLAHSGSGHRFGMQFEKAGNPVDLYEPQASLYESLYDGFQILAELSKTQTTERTEATQTITASFPLTLPAGGSTVTILETWPSLEEARRWPRECERQEAIPSPPDNDGWMHYDIDRLVTELRVTVAPK